ncbi:MAG: radical SAM protein [Nanoarchaeota archaeon]
MKEKILLINPNFESSFKYKKKGIRENLTMPLGLLCIGTYLKHHGFTVKIIDMNLNTIQTVINEAKEALWIGFSVMTAQIRYALNISQQLKKLVNVPIVWGGIHPTLFPEQTCDDDAVDFVVFQEGEETALELTNHFKRHDTDYSMIKGIVYKERETIKKTAERVHIDLNKLPNLDYSLVEVEKYIWKTGRDSVKHRVLNIISSRGCPHRCNFCFHVLCNDRKYRVKDVDKTIAEIKELVDKYKITALTFSEDNFFVQRKRVVEICNRLIEGNFDLRWGKTECRADYFREGHVDDDLLKLIKKAGCASLSIGAESGSIKTLNMIHKDITPGQIMHAANQLDKHKIRGNFLFMIGLPNESKKDILLTVKIVKKIQRKYPEIFAITGIYRPYPPGELYTASFRLAGIKAPEKLRDWIINDYMKLQTFRSDLPWSKHSKLIQNIFFYLYISHFNKSTYLKRLINKFGIMGFGFLVFVIWCTFRVNLNFYSIPLEKHIFYYINKKLNMALI